MNIFDISAIVFGVTAIMLVLYGFLKFFWFPFYDKVI